MGSTLWELFGNPALLPQTPEDSDGNKDSVRVMFAAMTDLFMNFALAWYGFFLLCRSDLYRRKDRLILLNQKMVNDRQWSEICDSICKSGKGRYHFLYGTTDIAK